MTNKKNKQLQLEREAWLRTLDYIRQENVFLKNRLADIVKNKMNVKMLEQAEYFQSLLINKDTTIAFLRYEIGRQNKYAELETESTGYLHKIVKRQDALRTDMEKMDKEISRVNILFSDYMAEALTN